MAKTSGYSRAYRAQRMASGGKPLGGRGVSASELRVGDIIYTRRGEAGNRITSINSAGNFTLSGGHYRTALRRDIDNGGWYVKRRNGTVYPIRQTPFQKPRR